MENLRPRMIKTNRLKVNFYIKSTSVRYEKLIRHLENLSFAFQFCLFFLIQADFAVCQIAGWIRRPGIIEVQIGPYPQTPAAAVKELAESAPSLNVSATFFQTFEKRIVYIGRLGV